MLVAVDKLFENPARYMLTSAQSTTLCFRNRGATLKVVVVVVGWGGVVLVGGGGDY